MRDKRGYASGGERCADRATGTSCSLLLLQFYELQELCMRHDKCETVGQGWKWFSRIHGNNDSSRKEDARLCTGSVGLV
jgi:hypothetical protein